MINYQKISALRSSKNLSVKQLAEMAEISRQTMSGILNGRSTKNSTLDKIARALGVPVSTFFTKGKVLITEDRQSPRLDKCPECEKKQMHIDMLFNQLKEKTAEIQRLRIDLENYKKNEPKSKPGFA